MLKDFEKPYTDIARPSAKKTLDVMSALARQGSMSDALRRLTGQIVQGLPSKDTLSELAALTDWVEDHIRYTKDPRFIERVQTVEAILSDRNGDCDCKIVLLGAMILSIGGKVRFVAGHFPGRSSFSHVWLEAWEPKSRRWVVLDPVVGKKTTRMIKKTLRRLVKNV